MKKTLIFSAVAVTTAILLLAGIGLLTSPKETPAQKIDYPDGSTLTLAGVSYGPTNSLLLGKSWQKYLYNLLPAKFKKWSRAQMIITGTGGRTNSPMFWILKTKTQPTSDEFLTIQILDEYGCELKRNGYSMSGNSHSQDEWLSSYQLDSVPPHGKVIGIAVYDPQDHSKRLGNFLIPGNKLPAKVSSSVLLEQTNGDLKIQFLSLQTGLKAGGYPAWYATNTQPSFTQVAFRVVKAGTLVSNWDPVSVQLTGADGKIRRPRFQYAARRGDDVIFNIDGELPPELGPWRMRFEFNHESDFTPEELVEIRGVPFPATIGVNYLNTNVEFQHTTLRIEQTLGAWMWPPTNFWATTPPPPYFRMAMTPQNSSLHLRFVKATDETGNNQSAGTYPSTLGGKYYFKLKDFTNAQTLNLTFALYPSRFVEFEANSTAYPTDSSPPR